MTSKKRYHIKLSISERTLKRKDARKVLHKELDKIIRKLKKQIKEREENVA